jgi:hypothetical protein
MLASTVAVVSGFPIDGFGGPSPPIFLVWIEGDGFVVVGMERELSAACPPRRASRRWSRTGSFRTEGRRR